jgi:hypothetical protein
VPVAAHRRAGITRAPVGAARLVAAERVAAVVGDEVIVVALLGALAPELAAGGGHALVGALGALALVANRRQNGDRLGLLARIASVPCGCG